MASTVFIDNQTTIYAAWLNDVNSAVYDGVFQSSTITATSMVCTGTASGVGFTNLINNTFASPDAIGSATPNTGAFTTLTATTLTATTINATTLNATGITTPLPLKGTTSGTVSLAVPAVAGTNTITFPSGSGTVAVQGLSTNIVSGTAVASTSGTSIDFTGIPNWAKRITVIFNNVSLSGTSNIIVQLGTSSGVATTGYLSTATRAAGTVGTTSVTTGFNINNTLAAEVVSGLMTISNQYGNLWVSSHTTKYSTSTTGFGGGDVTLGDVLNRVRITSVNGTDTFDAGSINILYE
jgi:hypothetical protein